MEGYITMDEKDGYASCPRCGKKTFRLSIDYRGKIWVECTQCEYSEQIGEEV